ncbi:GTP diphosphokinase [Oceanimonas baumannii]|uniref:GTP pyrophosphokinase n=1 Tax=Oceanimonas baumannii TaxID=129578 RepID=A0A235CJ91_9GAMM|nr:GTP diphosphokinase [Oceanimonas baumannii]OYD24661.1 GTP diphosphokinase [Oceanimonas baumannii]TDW59405.1 GTP pyrophosphokinase [Oceanimonas baumannii]
MVAVRETHLKSTFCLQEWVDGLSVDVSERARLKAIYEYCRQLDVNPETSARLLAQGVEMVGILLTLSMDADTLRSALLYPFLENRILTAERVQEDFGDNIHQLLQGVADMEAIRSLQHVHGDKGNEAQADKVRRMLLAMVEDVRAVVIKLAERITCLREVKNADEETRVLVAKEIANIYAPLANRLGIGQLKWELEDLSFRYLHPETYKRIARLLDEKRLAREDYIASFVGALNHALHEAGVDAEVYGRPKHIYSIWRKMQKKSLDFDELFDVRAVRVVTHRLQDCYAALGIVHTQWRHIPREFDDYVANPKPNGYQSIHTVVIGPEGKTVEIQIRTEQMHQDAELGVAAHWKYKEGAGSGKQGGYEEKIAWLRKLLAWQEDMAESGSLVDELRSQVFEDRVYVFTPKGDVVDMPAGATPLDFAYYVHSQVGHRCIGAKIDGRIVPFTYQLQTGDQVEIITQKHPNPSRDWMNPNQGFLRTSRARSKVATWFKKQDRDKNILAGRELLDKELERLGMGFSWLDKKALERFNVTSLDDLLAGIGGGDLRINQLLNYLQSQHKKPSSEEQDQQVLRELEQKAAKKPQDNKPKGHIVVQGVGNLLTNTARCCQPIPGDEIIGFITQGRGISIHRADCEQLKELALQHPERMVDAVWGEDNGGGYQLTLRVVANDRSGLLRDITTILANEKINVMGVNSRSNRKQQTATIDMELEVYNIDTLSRTLARIGQLPDILEARRL